MTGPKPAEPTEPMATEPTAIDVPKAIEALLLGLWRSGHAAYVVGGSLRDVLLDRHPSDWDLTTDATPEQIQAIFPDSIYENRFGTVAVRSGGALHEITTFRSDHAYEDHRRPTRVEFGSSIEEDLARRDFTVNAIAWGAPAPDPLPAPSEPAGSAATLLARARLVDPFGGRADLAARVLRAVGDPDARFHEDALRMLRAVRLAAQLGFEIDPPTFEAIGRQAHLAAHVSWERVFAELEKLLAAPLPSVGLRLMAESGLLAVLFPALEPMRGLPQAKIPGDDLWAHTWRTVDALPADRPVLRLAGLLHDVGKPTTLSDGHFPGHDVEGAKIAALLLDRLHAPRATISRVERLIAAHMFSYDGAWSDQAVRRFIARIGEDLIDDLFALREADNVASGAPGGGKAWGVDELRARVDAQLHAEVPLRREDLAVDGRTLMAELNLSPGPKLGRLIDELLERVLAEPALNERAALMDLAREIAPMLPPDPAPQRGHVPKPNLQPNPGGGLGATREDA